MILHQFNMEECIRALLERWGLSQYADVFIKNGYDDVNIIRDIDENDLQAMGISCLTEKNHILSTLSQLNKMFRNYMSVDESYMRPSSEHVLSFVAEKLEREGVLPSGEDILSLVVEKLDEEGILLSPYNHQMYITKDGYKSTRREYNMLRARFAQELFLPNQSVIEALKLIHERSEHGHPPPKPPKPKVKPIYDPNTGKLIWLNNQDSGNYENVNYLYNLINQISPPTLPARNPNQHSPLTSQTDDPLKRYEDVLKFEVIQSANNSPVPVRQVKKKQTFFKRMKHNLFGKSNSSLDSYLASSTKTLISDRSSECSNSKLSFFNKSKVKKDKGRYERQRSNSAPEPGRNVNLHQIPENNKVPAFHPPPSYLPPCQTPVYAKPYHKMSCSGGDTDKCVCGPNDVYAHVYRTDVQIEGTPVHPAYPSTPACLPAYPPAVKSDTFSNTSISSGSVSGDSAYSSKPCLNATQHRPYLYGAVPVRPEQFTVLTTRPEQFAVPHPTPHPALHAVGRALVEQPARRCPCCTCNTSLGRE